ncbi:LysR family transcriptional regulator [Thalassotalea insulae]|uniref:LysR family transcriptional regulator n=1 Tax=Thalassotalea insulae TaxID=2056778 RepID=A0ABQ6GRJ6_9GAMM|nr:LysR family transcriptional regulator [Thalassotalea insulae]GLX78570.1 LysR family transcriptional regulator [Thalassotalea insulae]
MEFYHLRSFVAVAQTGNLTQAAKRLYSTPPAISAHIKALEQELSTALFVRSSKGMALTDKGRLLLEKAQATLTSAQDLVNTAANNQHDIIGHFRLAINLPVERIKLPQLINNLKENCPGISVDIHQQATGKTLVEIREQQLDGGYISGDVPEDCLGINVKQQQITTIAPLRYDANKLQSQSALNQQPWITMGDYCPFDIFLKEKLGDDVPSALTTSDNSTRLELVKNGVGLSFLEYEEAIEAADKQQIQIIPTLDFSTPLHFIVLKQRATEPVIKALRQEIRILWGVAL